MDSGVSKGRSILSALPGGHYRVDKPRLGDRRSGLKCWGLEVMEALFGRQLTTGM